MRFGLNKHTHTNTVQFPGLECHFQRVQLDCASINKLKQYFHLRDLQKFKNCPTASKVLDKKYAIVRKYVALSLIWAVCERVKFFPSIQDLFSKKKKRRRVSQIPQNLNLHFYPQQIAPCLYCITTKICQCQENKRKTCPTIVLYFVSLTVIETSLRIVSADIYISTIRPTVFLYSSRCSKHQRRKHRIKVAKL